jgi:hypothetical protein
MRHGLGSGSLEEQIWADRGRTWTGEGSSDHMVSWQGKWRASRAGDSLGQVELWVINYLSSEESWEQVSFSQSHHLKQRSSQVIFCLFFFLSHKYPESSEDAVLTLGHSSRGSPHLSTSFHGSFCCLMYTTSWLNEYQFSGSFSGVPRAFNEIKKILKLPSSYSQMITSNALLSYPNFQETQKGNYVR